MSKPQSHQAPQRRRIRLDASPFVVLCLLLLIPAYALSQLAASIDWRLLAGVPLVLSAFTLFAYRSDKRRAEAGEWRIPEFTLHVSALLGGWPGAFLGQRLFRHKTSKISFQFIFWIIVLTHEFIAVDSLLGWRFTKDVVRLIRDLTG